MIGVLFLFIAFDAFTDLADPSAVCINCALILGAIAGFDQTVVARPEPDKEKMQVLPPDPFLLTAAPPRPNDVLRGRERAHAAAGGTRPARQRMRGQAEDVAGRVGEAGAPRAVAGDEGGGEVRWTCCGRGRRLRWSRPSARCRSKSRSPTRSAAPVHSLRILSAAPAHARPSRPAAQPPSRPAMCRLRCGEVTGAGGAQLIKKGAQQAHYDQSHDGEEYADSVRQPLLKS